MKTLVIDDSILIREGIVRILHDAGFEIVGQRSDATGLIDLIDETGARLVVIDIRMPPTHTTEGLEAAIALRANRPEVAIVLVSQYVETRYAVELLADGRPGVGYLLKDRIAAIEEFVDAVRRVAAGGTVIDPQVVARMVARQRRNNPLETLSEREREVLALMAEGRSNQAIADRLIVNFRTVETHVSSLLSKLGIGPEPDDHRRVRAVLLHLTHTSGETQHREST
jgi:DNA-binding NarL/FixJ family response regulator